MLAQPSMIKRPVLELGGGKLLVGFKPEEYALQIRGQLVRSFPRKRESSGGSRDCGPGSPLRGDDGARGGP